MTIAAGATNLGRAFAESLMDSTCTITKVETSTLDPATALPTTTRTTVYSGSCRLRWPRATATEVDGRGQILAEQTPELWIPVTADGSGDVAPDMEVTITANPQDTSLVGKTARVKGLHFQTHATARRLQIEFLS